MSKIEQQEAAAVEITKTAHREWLANPVTKQWLALLGAYGEALLQESQATPETILASVRTAKSVLGLCSNTEKFVELHNKLTKG